MCLNLLGAFYDDAPTEKKSADMAQNAQEGTVDNMKLLLPEDLIQLMELPEASVLKYDIEKLCWLCVNALLARYSYLQMVSDTIGEKEAKRYADILKSSLESNFFNASRAVMDDLLGLLLYNI